MDIITQYLLSLSEGYQTFALGLNMKIEDTWTFNTVKGMVRVEDQRRSNTTTVTLGTVASDPEAVKANFAKKSSKKLSKKFTGKCHHCGIIGHMKADCRKRVEEEKRSRSTENNFGGPYGGLAAAMCKRCDERMRKT